MGHIEPSYEQQVAEMAATRALEKFVEQHECLFPTDQRKVLHAVAEIDPEALRLVIVTGKVMQKAVGKAVSGIATCIIIALFVLFLYGMSLVTKTDQFIK